MSVRESLTRRGSLFGSIGSIPSISCAGGDQKTSLRLSSRLISGAGGKYLWCMRSPEDQDYWGIGIYREIVELERIVYTDAFPDAKGNVVPASHYGMSGDRP